MYKYRLIILLLIFMNIPRLAFSQFVEQEQLLYFGSRIKNPIKINVLTHRDKITFQAENESYFPYKITLSFVKLANLTPVISKKSFTVRHGTTRLMSFSIISEDIAYDYGYKYHYSIKPAEMQIAPDYPYLIPIGEKKEIKKFAEKSLLNHISNFINLRSGDTIYAMRKGIITANPNTHKLIDKISSHPGAVEILHEDGTAMIYIGLNPDEIFVSLGETVYPGQAVGLIKHNDFSARLFLIKEGGRVLATGIKYIYEKDKEPLFLDGILDYNSIYPAEVIIKEFTNFEKRRYSKNKLY